MFSCCFIGSFTGVRVHFPGAGLDGALDCGTLYSEASKWFGPHEPFPGLVGNGPGTPFESVSWFVLRALFVCF